jgi:hypothetical protein
MIALLVLAASSAALAKPEPAAIFAAAGATRRGARWIICTEDLNASARIDSVEDLNGDGRPEAVVSEDGTFCHGASGTGFVLLSKQANGKWKSILASDGIPEFLKARGVGGWPDISVGGPGFCFPVLRWNGRTYVQHRREYEGRPCR